MLYFPCVKELHSRGQDLFLPVATALLWGKNSLLQIPSSVEWNRDFVDWLYFVLCSSIGRKYELWNRTTASSKHLPFCFRGSPFPTFSLFCGIYLWNFSFPTCPPVSQNLTITNNIHLCPTINQIPNGQKRVFKFLLLFVFGILIKVLFFIAGTAPIQQQYSRWKCRKQYWLTSICHGFKITLCDQKRLRSAR